MSEFDKSFDAVIGVALSTFLVLGITLNAVSFLYFFRLKTRNTTGEFFKRLYMVITINDCLICAALAPTIDGAFSLNREGALDKSSRVCLAAVFFAWIFPQMSIFLVGMLSTFRLFVLKYPTRILHQRLAIIIPVTLYALVLAICVIFRLSDILHARYFPEWISCVPNCFPSSRPDGDLVTHGDVYKALTLSIPYNLIPGLSIIPISVSCVMTLLELRRSRQVAVSIHSSCERQKEATRTVVIVTMLYIVLSIPYTAFLVLIVSKMSVPLKAGETVASFTSDRFTSPSEIEFVNNYLALIVFVVFPSLNSVINPMIYFARIRHFRIKVTRGVKRCAMVKHKVSPNNKTTHQHSTRESSA